jgi:hypothetical protein
MNSGARMSQCWAVLSILKESSVPGLWKATQNQKVSHGYFKRLKEPSIFMKKPAKNSL